MIRYYFYLLSLCCFSCGNINPNEKNKIVGHDSLHKENEVVNSVVKGDEVSHKAKSQEQLPEVLDLLFTPCEGGDAIRYQFYSDIDHAVEAYGSSLSGQEPVATGHYNIKKGVVSIYWLTGDFSGESENYSLKRKKVKNRYSQEMQYCWVLGKDEFCAGIN